MSKVVLSKEKWCFPPEKVLPNIVQDFGLPEDPLMREIFAPDPISGNPCSDLRLMISGENQELNEYIRTHLMNPVSGSSLLGSSDEDGEVALDALPRLSDDENEYFNRLAKLASANVDNQEVK